MKKIVLSTIMLASSLIACGGGDKTMQKTEAKKSAKNLNLDSIAAASPKK